MYTEKQRQILTTYWLLRSRYVNMRGISRAEAKSFFN